MARKLIQHNLVKNSISAFYAAIELHNKPIMPYRYETVCILFINAWELLLKAFIKKYIKDRSIFGENQNTITLDKCLSYVDEYINKGLDKNSFRVIRENIVKIEEYRDNIIHFYNDKIEPIIFSIIAKNSVDYVEFINRYFNKKILDKDQLFIMPLGFKLPFKPEDYLKEKYAEYNYSEETKNYINSVVNVIKSLSNDGIEESIVIGFDIYLEKINKCSNSDIIAAIANDNNGESINIIKTYANTNITNDPNAPKVNLTDDEFLRRYPLTYKQLTKLLKDRYKDFVVKPKFHKHKKEIQNDKKYCYLRKLYPQSDSIIASHFYSYNVFEHFDKFYIRK